MSLAERLSHTCPRTQKHLHHRHDSELARVRKNGADLHQEGQSPCQQGATELGEACSYPSTHGASHVGDGGFIYGCGYSRSKDSLQALMSRAADDVLVLHGELPQLVFARRAYELRCVLQMNGHKDNTHQPTSSTDDYLPPLDNSRAPQLTR